ncbi:MAG: fimbrillin family protein [Bacteroides sp.]|nr:fimbrillin family protein [Bacteroides sp.]
MKKYTIYYLLSTLLVLVSACSKDQEIKELMPGEVPINPIAVLTRADGLERNNIYIKALQNNSNYTYFDETLANIPDGLTTSDAHNIVFPIVTPYYPLGNVAINIFGYSGKAPDEKMHLTAGKDITNDAILSNYGKRQSDTAADPNTAPGGTLGSSEDPAEILQFRHVMTQVIVNIELATGEVIDPAPQKVEFTLSSGAVAQGRYPIRGVDVEPAVETSGSYTLSLGTNYLVPTGVDLVGKTLTTLTIDDYVALPADLTNYQITPSGAEPTMELLPGYSYELTLTISRLKLNGVRLRKIDWIPHEVFGPLSYTPYNLALNLGSYSNTDTDTISKVVLMTTDNKQYVGKSRSGNIEFVTLPADGTVNNVTLYTDKGLLTTNDIQPANYAAAQLTMNLSAGGMLAADPSNNAISEDNPYMITTPVQFMNVAKDLSSHYRLAATIDLHTLNLIDQARIFNGFGAFTGSFDGNSYRIDGIDIQAPGLFVSNSGTIKNIRISTGTVDGTGQTYAGSLCGSNTGTIVACVNEARIINADDATTMQGGICGFNSTSGQIIGCVNTGTILYGNTVGGICGENQNPSENTIIACINTGTLNPSATDLGFIIGRSVDSANNVVHTSFSLVGSAQHIIGSDEYPIGTGNTGFIDTSALEPLILRNGLQEGSTENERIINKLNTALSTYTSWGTDYMFFYDDPTDGFDPDIVTGITWPAPIQRP